jgi:hypothetical protein
MERLTHAKSGKMKAWQMGDPAIGQLGGERVSRRGAKIAKKSWLIQEGPGQPEPRT